MHISDVHDYSDDEQACEQAKEFIEKNRKDKIKREIECLIDDEFDRLEEYASNFISEKAAERAERFLSRVLNGDEEAAMALLGSANNIDRVRLSGIDAGKPWASIYRGRDIFETDGIKLRRKIVEAHADILRNERIADLESIVEGLTQQIVELNAKLDLARNNY